MDQALTFEDLDDGDESIVIVRTVPGGVGLTISKKANGDLEVVMPPDIAERWRKPSETPPFEPPLRVHSCMPAQPTTLLSWRQYVDDERPPICPSCGVTMVSVELSARDQRDGDWVCLECEELGEVD